MHYYEYAMVKPSPAFRTADFVANIYARRTAMTGCWHTFETCSCLYIGFISQSNGSMTRADSSSPYIMQSKCTCLWGARAQCGSSVLNLTRGAPLQQLEL